jgi:DNA-binding MarR family transcriptional regulator
MRPSELAEALLITKQSVNDLLRGLERGGYITLAVSPKDRRSRLIRLTRKGMRLEETVRLAARDAERRLVQELGRKRFLDFREALGEAAEILNATARPQNSQVSAVHENR